MKLLSTLPFKVVIFSIPFNLLLLFPNVILSRFSWFSLYSLRTVVVDRFINHLCINRLHNCIRGVYRWFTHFNTFQELPFPSIHRNTQSYPSFAETHCLCLVFSDYKTWPLQVSIPVDCSEKANTAYVLNKGLCVGGWGRCPKLPKCVLDSIFASSWP